MKSDSFKQSLTSSIDRMYRTARFLCGNDDDASDAVQDASMKLWENRRLLTGVSNFEAYALQTVRNACFDIIKKRRAVTDVDSAFSLFAGDIASEIESRDTVENICRIIDRLPAGQRTVITMRDIDGCSMDEIEAATGYTTGNIKVLLCRARNTIRKFF